METIKCKSCGAVQEVSVDNSTCSYCGDAIEIQQSKDFYKETINSETGNLMAMAETAIDATNWEEALQYFNRVLEKEITNSDAWLGKGIAIVYTSKIGEIKTAEAIVYWKNAIKHAANESAMSKRVAKEIDTVVNGFYPAIENHYIQFRDMDDSYQELVSRFATLENAQDYATQLYTENIAFFETGYALCNRVIDLPKKYASATSSSALAEGIVGQLSSNEYSRKYAAKDASGKIRKANERKKEIVSAALIISALINKYAKGIKNIDSAFVFIPYPGQASAVDENTVGFVVNTYNNYLKLHSNSHSSARFTAAQELKKILGIKDYIVNPLVNEILIKNNLLTKSEIVKQEIKSGISVVVIMIVVILVIWFCHRKN